MFKNLIRHVLSVFGLYTEGSLALRAQGFLGVIGIGKETTWGTAVAATDYMQAFSENLSLTKDRFELMNMFGTYAEPDDAVGLDRVAGDIVVPGYPIALGMLLKSVFNNTTGSTVLSGTLYTTRFITTQSEFSPESSTPPYTYEIFRDVTSSHRYFGVCTQRLQMTIAPNAPLQLTASLIGRQSSIIAKSAHTFPGSPLAPFTFDTCSVSVGGVANTRLENVTITIDNQLIGTPALNASALIARIRRQNPQIITIAGNYDFTDINEYLDFVNQTERAMKFTLTKAASFQFCIEMPRVIYTAFPMGVPGRDRITVAFEGKARFNTSSNLAIDCGLTCTKSNW